MNNKKANNHTSIQVELKNKIKKRPIKYPASTPIMKIIRNQRNLKMNKEDKIMKAYDFSQFYLLFIFLFKYFIYEI